MNHVQDSASRGLGSKKTTIQLLRVACLLGVGVWPVYNQHVLD